MKELYSKATTCRGLHQAARELGRLATF